MARAAPARVRKLHTKTNPNPHHRPPSLLPHPAANPLFLRVFEPFVVNEFDPVEGGRNGGETGEISCQKRGATGEKRGRFRGRFGGAFYQTFCPNPLSILTPSHNPMRSSITTTQNPPKPTTIVAVARLDVIGFAGRFGARHESLLWKAAVSAHRGPSKSAHCTQLHPNCKQRGRRVTSRAYWNCRNKSRFNGY